MGLLLLIVLILLLVGGLPTWGYSRNWGYGPSGLVGLESWADSSKIFGPGSNGERGAGPQAQYAGGQHACEFLQAIVWC
jgi:Protein of unknown function (DUF3309)